MANTVGGVILLGVEEKPRGHFAVVGLADPGKLKSDLWNLLNNPQKVSVNLLSDDDVDEPEVEGHKLLRIRVRRARRHERPVYVNANPMTGTYRRNNEGDYRCPPEVVKRLLAEQVEDSRDAKLVDSFDMSDLDASSFAAYRQTFASTKPTHPWIQLSDAEFLRSIGAWTVDRESGKSGLTIAGLLMFGKLRSILDGVPHYIVDYQEWPARHRRSAGRWIDRVTTDGSWSGNLYDFYRTVIQRLGRDLPIPFKLQEDRRIDDTPVHEALREALVNTLIHADYGGRTSILILKRPDLFAFRNPGTMRLPIAEALRGGNSDCRNRNLQKMFQLVGLGEQAGSGIPKIVHSWREQHWRAPEIAESFEPEQTRLAMRMVSLLPQETIDELTARFGDDFTQASETQRLALATVAIEGTVTHARLRTMSDLHPRDITRELGDLVSEGLLQSEGATRATQYFFTGEAPLDTGDLLALDAPSGFGSDLAPSSVIKSPRSVIKAPSSVIKKGGSSVIKGARSVIKTASSVIKRGPPAAGSRPHSKDISPAVWTELLERTDAIRSNPRVDPAKVDAAILAACQRRFLSRQDLALLLGRTSETLRLKYLNRLVKSGALELEFPAARNHPHQRYRAQSSRTTRTKARR